MMSCRCCSLFLLGSSAQLADSARFVKRVSTTVDLNEQVRVDDDHDVAGGGSGGGEGGSGGRKHPLFLASVVGQRFPYRWLVMAMSAFVCMAIIATLSVVYSNTW